MINTECQQASLQQKHLSKGIALTGFIPTMNSKSAAEFVNKGIIDNLEEKLTAYMTKAKTFNVRSVLVHIPADCDIITMGARYARTVTFPPCAKSIYDVRSTCSKLAYTFLTDCGNPTDLLDYMLCNISSDEKRLKVIGMLIAFQKIRLELLGEIILALKYFVCTKKITEKRLQQVIEPFKNLYLCFCQNNISHFAYTRLGQKSNVRNIGWDISPMMGWNTASTIYGTHCHAGIAVEEMNKNKRIFSPEVQARILGYYCYEFVCKLMPLLTLLGRNPRTRQHFSQKFPVLYNANSEWFELLAGIGDSRMFTNLMIHGSSFNDNYLGFTRGLESDYALPIFRYIEYLTKTQILKPLADSFEPTWKRRRV